MSTEAGWGTSLAGQVYQASPESAATHELVMRYHQAWCEQDIDAQLAMLDPDVEYTDFFQGRRIALGELRDYLVSSMTAGDESQVYTDRLRVDGDTAFLQYQLSLQGTRGLVSFRVCEAITVRNGLVVRVNEHASLITRHDMLASRFGQRAAGSRLGLSARQLGQLASDLQQYFEQGRPFLNPELDMPQVAQVTGYTRNQISFFLNQVLGCSFYQHINQLRLRHLLGQLEGVGSAQRIDELAKVAGFRSLSTFYRCFREETGLSPKAYLERQAAD